MKRKCLVLNKLSEFYDAIKKLDENGDGLLPIINDKGYFVGLVTDGDVRRAVLNRTLDLEHIINKHPYKLTTESTTDERAAYLKKVKRRHLPIVNKDNRLIEIFTLDSMAFRIMPNPVVIMAGGLGSRFGELTKNIPKPMLHVGGKPLLETILISFIELGFHKFYISVNYKKEIIMDYFGDGSRWGVNIEYLVENKRLGTAGSLSLLREKQLNPLIVVNGDVMASLDFVKLLKHHKEHKSKVTMCVREYEHTIPYGVVQINNSEIVSIKEKPKMSFKINTGIYVLDPDVIERVPRNVFYDMTTLFHDMEKYDQKRCAYVLREYWIDIGSKDDYQRANRESLIPKKIDNNEN